MNQPLKKSPKTSYYIRIAAGGYLLYTAYSINSDWAQVKTEHKLAMGAAIVVFIIVGFILCLVSALGLNKYNRTQADNEKTNTGATNEQSDHLELDNTNGNVKERAIEKVDARDASGYEVGEPVGKDSESDA